MQIFTFWEPRESMPYYLQLCMATWRKFLPDAEITVLDRDNILDYVDLRIFGENLFSGRFSLPQVADAIRVALLAKHGGIWLDVDTVILNSSAKKYFETDAEYPVTFFGDPVTRNCHICFIKTSPKSYFMNLWLNFILERLHNLKDDTFIDWDFLGNSFVNDYAKNHLNEIKVLDRTSAMPELSIATDLSSNARTQAYMKYYFLQQWHIEEVPADILLLHNSWTPRPFVEMGKENFLRCNCTMANILMAALDMKRNLNAPPITFKLD